MAKYLSKVILVFLCICTFMLTSCENYAENTLYALNTLIHFKTDGKLPDGTAQKINSIEKKLSRTLPDSEIAKLNDGQTVTDEETVGLIKTALHLCEQTDGAFDITCGAVTELWGIGTEAAKVPDDTQISDALATVGYDKINIDSGRVSANGAVIDLGGIAKGYTAQKTVEYLRASGVESGVISFGGNIAVIGPKADGSAWAVGLKDPEDTSKTVGNIFLYGGYVSVSGGYERYFESDGVRYHHIFDSKTGRPAQTDVLSVAVISDDGTEADALSTALFVMGKDAATDFYAASHFDFELIIITDTEILVSDGLRDSFTADGRYEIKYFNKDK